ncbi:DNA-binding protein [Aphanizomenon sp. 202]|uniref:DNA-binding protein n=1 Tax=Dolichospermum heterosporum TAC447 TaxID=747523 RepID=A0ABY5LXT6_9CYAN|nr:DNA-binding protein [Dolichospermum heterosporum]MDK2411758.1 DNA-binding protein [Aphanizomenon sp. 202]UUO15465.1 DNA-binding protein [Dolichospermum heterosporum TAC447]
MTVPQEHEDLKIRVFEICENLYIKNEKINRNIVRERLGGGSFSTIGPLIREWKELKSVQFNSLNGTEIEDESTESGTESHLVLSQKSVITATQEELTATSVNPAFIPDSDINSMVRAGAEKAAGTLIAQEAIATHFYQNPDELPADLRAQLEGARGNFTQSHSNTSKAAYNPQNLINLAMEKIKKTQRKDGLELIG